MNHITVTASDHSSHKDITLLSVKGFIDTNTAPEFEKTFQTVLGANKFKLIVDLKDVNYISSAGWGIFVGEIKRIRGQKGDLFLAAMSPEVAEAYDLLQFSTILKSFPDVEQAVQKGFGKAKSPKGSVETKFEQVTAPVPAAKVVKGKSAAKTSVVAQTPTEQPVVIIRRKTPWIEKALKPWKWFE